MSNDTFNLIIIALALYGGITYSIRNIFILLGGIIKGIYWLFNRTEEVKIKLKKSEQLRFAEVIKHENRLPFLTTLALLDRKFMGSKKCRTVFNLKTGKVELFVTRKK